MLKAIFIPRLDLTDANAHQPQLFIPTLTPTQAKFHAKHAIADTLPCREPVRLVVGEGAELGGGAEAAKGQTENRQQTGVAHHHASSPRFELHPLNLTTKTGQTIPPGAAA